MTISSIECDLADFIHQSRADVARLRHKLEMGLMDDAEAVAHQLDDDIDAIDRCVQQIMAEYQK